MRAEQREREALRKHADHGVILGVERKVLPDRFGRLRKQARGQFVAEQSHRPCARPVFLGQKSAAGDRMNSQDVKEIPGCPSGRQALWLAVSGQIQFVRDAGGQTVEGPAALRYQCEKRVGERPAALGLIRSRAAQ